MAPNLTTLPAEIKHNIFSNLTTITDLSALVHASASYYRTYLSDGTREKLLTDLTLSELEARDVNLFHPVPFLEICLRDRARLGPETESAIVAARAQKKAQIRARAKGVKVVPRIRLEVEECVALRNVEDILPWEIKDGELSLACGDEYVLRALSYGRHNYYAMTDSPTAVTQFKGYIWGSIDSFEAAADWEFKRRPLRDVANHLMYDLNWGINCQIWNILSGRNDGGRDFWTSGR